MINWINETLYPDWEQRFRVARVLADERSPFQHVLIFESISHGRVLVLDGCVQVTERDEFIYQEMIAHVPLIAHGAPRRVLIIGAGDGGVLRRVLQHRQVETAVMVEIDEAVVRLCREFLPAIGAEAWSDPRAQVLIGDGIDYVARAADESFDVIIVDSTDPAGVGEVLFTEGFYADCARVLSSSGIIVNQAGVPFMQPDELRSTTARRAKSFPNASAFLVPVPTYVGGAMTIGISTKQAHLQELAISELETRAQKAGIVDRTRYWSPSIQAAAFVLPPFIEEILS